MTYSLLVNAQFSEDSVLQLHSGTQTEMNSMNTGSDKTKLFYNITDNKIYSYNGSSWVMVDGRDLTTDAWKDIVGSTHIKLEAKSDGTARDTDTEFVIHDDGNVGIGAETNTQSKLQIEGEGVYEGMLRLINTGSNGATFFMGSTADTWDIGANKFIMGHGNPASVNVNMLIQSNGNVGIGVKNPVSSLDLKSTSGLTLGGVRRTTWPANSTVGAFTDGGTKAYYNGGNVGIGVKNPASALHMGGMISTKKNQMGGNYAISLRNSNIGGINTIYFNDLGEGINWTSTGSIAANTKVEIYAKDDYPTSHFVILTNRNGNSGNVGINTTTPDEKFEIQFGDSNKDFEIGVGTTDTDITFFTLRSPDGTKHYVTVASDGSLISSTTKP